MCLTDKVKIETSLVNFAQLIIRLFIQPTNMESLMNVKDRFMSRFIAILAMVALPIIAQAQSAYLQVIHNAADPGAAVVDVYVSETLAIDDFTFRTATPFIELPAGVDIDVTVAPPTSATVADGIATFTVNLAANTNYIAVANGVLDPTAFADNPDGISTAFGLIIIPDARQTAENAADVDFAVLHGATDAPAVDVRLADGGAVLVPDAAYSDVSGYISVPPASYNVDITLPGDANAVVASYDIDVTSLQGGSAVLLASGFLSPAANNSGEAFGVLVVLADGTAFLAPTSTNIDENIGGLPNEFELKGNYPNPFNPTTNIQYSVPSNADVRLAVYDMLGREVAVLVNGVRTAGNYNVNFDATNLSSGVYLYRLQAGNFVQTQKMMLVK